MTIDISQTPCSYTETEKGVLVDLPFSHFWDWFGRILCKLMLMNIHMERTVSDSLIKEKNQPCVETFATYVYW